jgi:hypothetical protein
MCSHYVVCFAAKTTRYSGLCAKFDKKSTMCDVKTGVFPGLSPYKIQSKLTSKINGHRV